MPWLLPSRGRPKECGEAVESMLEMDTTEPVHIHIYAATRDEAQAYMRALPFPLPPNYSFETSEQYMGEAQQSMLAADPVAPYYGWFSDDMRARTRGWDYWLVKAAGLWNISDCNDGHLMTRAQTSQEVCGAVWFGGDLVRAVGWWTLPGTLQAGNDDAWVYLLQRLSVRYGVNLRIRVPEVVVEHISWRNEKRKKDATDCHPWLDDDMSKSGTWRKNEADAMADRVYAAWKRANP